METRRGVPADPRVEAAMQLCRIITEHPLFYTLPLEHRNDITGAVRDYQAGELILSGPQVHRLGQTGYRQYLEAHLNKLLRTAEVKSHHEQRAPLEPNQSKRSAGASRAANRSKFGLPPIPPPPRMSRGSNGRRQQASKKNRR